MKRPWRRRGLAFAMLRAAFGACYRRGIATVELSVDADSPTDAPGVYTRAGMHVTQSISLYRRQLRPGRDYNTVPNTTTTDA